MKWYKKIGLLGIVGLTSVLLAACNKSKASQSKDDTVTIEYFNQKKEMDATLKKIIKDFERENPKIHVKMTSVPDAGTVLKTRVLSGDVPDVINIYPQNMDFQEWSKAGYFYNMTGKAYLNHLKNHYANEYKVNQKVYSVPLTANVSGIYYNKTKFKELGLKVPETWDEFVKLVEEIKAKKETPFALAGTEGWTLNGYHQLSLISVTGSANAANKYLRFSQPNSIKTSDKILKEDMIQLNLLADDGNQQKNWKGASYNDALVAFANEKALMTPNGSWALPAIKQQDPKFEIGTFAFPGKKTGNGITVGAGDLALSISAKTKHLKEAEKFVKYMTTARAMQKYYDVDGSPVAVKGVREDKNSPLQPLTKLAFTDKHYVWLGQHWNSEDDFFTATTNYLMTKNAKGLADGLNAFFNPMKADVD
ncbi:sugar-binding protein MsmE [Streptococcus mutans]|nr:sugar-binding protein MsmE [Streptococcus mutans]MCB4999599.1 sugar-binding protein MsmE [Streptococcus mutans]MCB5021418.1 sugar-binding protein MsmE [Streptococcus mutans]MCB5090608.1 sugar-binding protein MsmE [Streptococcus mutans]